jgi:hypothetical protein
MSRVLRNLQQEVVLVVPVVQPGALGLLAALGAILLVACGPRADEPPARGAHDVPVPAAEPRAELRVKVDLTPRRDCDEVFDLALYQNAAIELVEWGGEPGSCLARVVKVRYLSARTTPGEVLAQIKKLSQHAEVTAP